MKLKGEIIKYTQLETSVFLSQKLIENQQGYKELNVN